jgi:uncharacterized protein YndB with AHSA1/START domain
MTDMSGAIVREIFIDATPEDVFPYFTDADKMVVWKAVSAEIDGVAGGDFRIDVTGAGHVARGAFLEIDAPRRVVFTWAWEALEGNPADLAVSIVEVTSTPDGDGTRLRLVHSGVPERRRDRSARGWDHLPRPPEGGGRRTRPRGRPVGREGRRPCHLTTTRKAVMDPERNKANLQSLCTGA